MDASLIAQTSKLRAENVLTDGLTSRTAALAKHTLNPEKARAAAQEFEAFFIGQMMEYMSTGIEADNMFGGGHAENTWRSMLNQEYGKQIAKSGGLGISDTVVKAMIDLQAKRTEAAQKLAGAADAPVAFEVPPTAVTQAATAALGSGVRRSVMA